MQRKGMTAVVNSVPLCGTDWRMYNFTIWRLYEIMKGGTTGNFFKQIMIVQIIARNMSSFYFLISGCSLQLKRTDMQFI